MSNQGGWIPFLLVWASLTFASQRFRCPEKHGLFPDPRQCDKYYMCVKEIPQEVLCPDGLMFNPHSVNINPCDHPKNVNCGNRTELQEPQPSLPNCPRQNGFFPHPDETICNVFFTCVQGKSIKHTCTSGLWFDANVGTCVWPASSHKINCRDERQVTKEGFRCPNEEVYNSVGQKVAHPKYEYAGDCKRFWICLNGVEPREHGCELGKVFSPKDGTCTYPEEVPGCEYYYEGHPDFDTFSRTATETRRRRLNEARQRLRQQEGDGIRLRGRGGRLINRPVQETEEEEEEESPVVIEEDLQPTRVRGGWVRGFPRAREQGQQIGGVVQERPPQRLRGLLFPKRRRGPVPGNRDDDVETIVEVVRVESEESDGKDKVVQDVPQTADEEDTESPVEVTINRDQDDQEEDDASFGSRNEGLRDEQSSGPRESAGAENSHRQINRSQSHQVTVNRNEDETKETGAVPFQPRSRGGAFRSGTSVTHVRSEASQRTVEGREPLQETSQPERDDEKEERRVPFLPRSRGGRFRGRNNSGTSPVDSELSGAEEVSINRGVARTRPESLTNIRYRSRGRGGVFGGKSKEDTDSVLSIEDNPITS